MGGAPPRRIPSLITDFVDVDSEKWRQYGEAGGLMGWLYRLEGRRLGAFERERACRSDHTLLVTKAERECFLRLAPELATRVHAVPNGVDTDYFSPEHCGENPFGAAPTLVFTGAMDYRPNAEAVLWFAREIFPRIREREPEATFCIVGLRPTPAVEALAGQPGITVTGRVPDVRPYVRHAVAVVAPLTIARGVQNKVLEAMAMAKAVVCTPQALEGIDARHGEHLFVASDPKPFVEAAVALIQRPERARELGDAARRYVRAYHGWPASVAMVEQLLREGEAGRSCTAEGGVRQPEPDPETSHAAAPRTTYESRGAESIRGEGAAPTGTDQSRRSCTAEGGVRQPEPDPETSHAAAPRTTYESRGAEGIRGEGAAPTGLDEAAEALNRPVGGAPPRRISDASPVGAQLRSANPKAGPRGQRSSFTHTSPRGQR